MDRPRPFVPPHGIESMHFTAAGTGRKPPFRALSYTAGGNPSFSARVLPMGKRICGALWGGLVTRLSRHHLYFLEQIMHLLQERAGGKGFLEKGRSGGFHPMPDDGIL